MIEFTGISPSMTPLPTRRSPHVRPGRRVDRRAPGNKILGGSPAGGISSSRFTLPGADIPGDHRRGAAPLWRARAGGRSSRRRAALRSRALSRAGSTGEAETPVVALGIIRAHELHVRRARSCARRPARRQARHRPRPHCAIASEPQPNSCGIGRCAMSSSRRFPAHRHVAVTSRRGKRSQSWPSDSSSGWCTSPETRSRCCAGSRSGTSPWLRTKKCSSGVTNDFARWASCGPALSGCSWRTRKSGAFGEGSHRPVIPAGEVTKLGDDTRRPRTGKSARQRSSSPPYTCTVTADDGFPRASRAVSRERRPDVAGKASTLHLATSSAISTGHGGSLRGRCRRRSCGAVRHSLGARSQNVRPGQCGRLAARTIAAAAPGSKGGSGGPTGVAYRTGAGRVVPWAPARIGRSVPMTREWPPKSAVVGDASVRVHTRPRRDQDPPARSAGA